MVTPRTLVWMSLMAAVVVFCGVQDRVTAAGARRYAALQREAIASGGRGPSIDEVVRPAVSRSVQQGLLWGGVVGAVGLGAAAAVRRGTR